MRLILVLTLASTALGGTWYYGRDQPDAWTQGEIWPLPYYVQFGKTTPISPGKVTVTAGAADSCDIIQQNVQQYVGSWLFPFPVNASTKAPQYVVTIKLSGDCPTGVPPSTMNETYSLQVNANAATLTASEVWGAIRGLESFSQLVYYDEDSNSYMLRTAYVVDQPRFAWRGLMLDTSRHFLSVKAIKRELDIMAANKLNVLHWHFTDSESFSYESAKFPNLTAQGAYSPRHFYKRADLQDIVDYARIRGIRVIPEFDTPGHTGAWGGQPGFLTQCYNSDGSTNDLPNLMDPSNEANFQFLKDFFDEVAQTFPDEYMHLGGDEVSGYTTPCWVRNPDIQAFMAAQGFTTTSQLENYYFQRLEDIVNNQLSVKKQHIFWEEVLENNSADQDAVIQIWEGDTFEEMAETIAATTATGHRVIVSSCWYLNYVKYGADWDTYIASVPQSRSDYYYCDPQSFDGTDDQKALVLGGIIGAWAEFFDTTNIEAILWPRGSAVAERLWSQASATTDAEAAWPRLHEFRCRMVSRGYRFSSNNWPDFCPFEYEQK